MKKTKIEITIEEPFDNFSPPNLEMKDFAMDFKESMTRTMGRVIEYGSVEVDVYEVEEKE